MFRDARKKERASLLVSETTIENAGEQVTQSDGI
jgi:hypothetical protein